MFNKLYFDTAATTPVSKEVVLAMNKVMIDDYGNASSPHNMGDSATKLLTHARLTLARTIGAKVQEIYFTSGTTESNNWAILGLAKTYPLKKKIIISSIEHPSIREPCNYLKTQGYEVIEIPVNKEGLIDFVFLEKIIDEKTLLVSVMHVNNIFGTIQNLKKIGDLCKRQGVLFHTDAAQSFGKLPILVHDWNIDLLSASAHKIMGPKGVGLIYIREGINISPLLYGGGQEKGRRSGTENIPGIVGFETALTIAKKLDWDNLSKLRTYLCENLLLIGGKIHGAREYNSAPHIVYVTFPRAHSTRLVYALSQKEIFISTGSACESKKKTEEQSLKAIAVSEAEASQSVRISLPFNTTKKEIDYFIKILKQVI